MLCLGLGLGPWVMYSQRGPRIGFASLHAALEADGGGEQGEERKELVRDTCRNGNRRGSLDLLTRNYSSSCGARYVRGCFKLGLSGRDFRQGWGGGRRDE